MNKPAINPNKVQNQAAQGVLSVKDKLTNLSGRVIQAAIAKVGINKRVEINN